MCNDIKNNNFLPFKLDPNFNKFMKCPKIQYKRDALAYLGNCFLKYENDLKLISFFFFYDVKIFELFSQSKWEIVILQRLKQSFVFRLFFESGIWLIIGIRMKIRNIEFDNSSLNRDHVSYKYIQ